MRYIILLAVLLVGCDNPFGPPMPDGAVESEPPPHFHDWWRAVQNDTGMEGDFDGIRWFRVASGPWEGRSGREIRGMWIRDSAQSRRIYIADPYWTQGGTVRHEMLHDILDDISHDHPLFSTFHYAAWFDY